jgi:hypothetical protein
LLLADIWLAVLWLEKGDLDVRLEMHKVTSPDPKVPWKVLFNFDMSLKCMSARHGMTVLF